MENKIYNDLVLSLSEFIPAIQINANLIAKLDCLYSFTIAAQENKYIRPVIEDSDMIGIKQGRHPVIETQMPPGDNYYRP